MLSIIGNEYTSKGNHSGLEFCLFVCVEVLQPSQPNGVMSSAVSLPNHRLTSIVHILSPETDNCPSWISGRERMTTENISWSISTKECLTRDLLVSSQTGIQLSHRGRLALSIYLHFHSGGGGGGVFLEKRICSPWEQILSFKNIPFEEEFIYQGRNICYSGLPLKREATTLQFSALPFMCIQSP